jgi:hypothetical protein
MNQGRKEIGYPKDKERNGWIFVPRDSSRDQKRNVTKEPRDQKRDVTDRDNSRPIDHRETK